MSFTSISFSAGEVPTTAKWNILNSNDASFNNGTGIGTNAIAAASLATNAITLGYAESTSNFTLGSSQTVQTLITGLSVTVAIPAGGRRTKITVYLGEVQIAQGNDFVDVQIWDGTVGSGTVIQKSVQQIPTSGGFLAFTMIAVLSPSAGSKTYNVGINNDSGSRNVGVNSSATNQSFILVEAI